VLLAYKAMGIDAGYLVTASFMNAPLAVMIAKIMVPETETPETMGVVRLSVPRIDVNIFDAAARGAGEGMQLALNVGAMLIAFVAIIYMVDGGVGLVGRALHLSQPLRLADLLGYPLAPLAWVMGVPWKDTVRIGSLLGTKTILNEFLAYQQLATMPGLDPRTIRIASFGLCGFANFGSLAIVLGGLGGMVPERRPDLARFGVKAIVAGSLATFLSGTLAGLIGG
jgi:CNT family concentrative nucleoside transporter